VNRPPTQVDDYRLDRRDVQRAFDRAATGYDAVSVLQQRVGAEHLERLELVRLDPAVVVDLGAGTGAGTFELRRRFGRGQVVAVDLSEAMLQLAGRRQRWFRRFHRVCADAAQLPLPDTSVDLLFSNLALHWCDDLDRVFAECRRVLRPGGLLTFTTYGPDTLVELRRAWAAADRGVHVNRFIDMHDLGDALVRAGFAEPVMDVERYTLTYATVRDLMRDLKSLGGHNVNAGRSRALTGKGTLARMAAAYESARVDERLPATFEVVFGHAWGPTGTPRARASSEVAVPVSRIGRRRGGASTG
jgi:malonyl-CoA O-methyltransferase